MLRDWLLKLLNAVDEKQAANELAAQKTITSKKEETIRNLKSSKDELAKLKESNDKLANENKKLTTEIKSLQKSIKEEKTSVTKQLNDQRISLNQNWEQKLSVAKITIENLKKEIVSNKKASSKENNDKIEKENKSSQVKESKEDNDELKYTQSALQNIIKELEDTKKKLKQAKDELKIAKENQRKNVQKEERPNIESQTLEVEQAKKGSHNKVNNNSSHEDVDSNCRLNLNKTLTSTEAYDDLPSQSFSDNRPTIRSIKAVIDLERNDKLINSDEFFKRKPAEISIVSRHLEICAQLGKPSMICACCHTPVKISKRTTSQGEGLFFTHCDHKVSCEWRPQRGSGDPSLSYEPYTPLDIAQNIKIKKFKSDKEIIFKALSSEVSKKLGIKDVNRDVYPINKVEHVSKRRTDFFCTIKDDIKLAIDLQTSAEYNSEVVNKDLFYRLNGYFVLWIFGAGEENYAFLKRHVIKNTLYANKRNAFIFDKEARNATIEYGTLILKCNYLDPDGEWHYRQETTGDNGVLINLKHLHFDDTESYRPYYFDANKEYFKENPNDESIAKSINEDRGQLLKDVESNWDEENKFVSNENLKLTDERIGKSSDQPYENSEPSENGNEDKINKDTKKEPTSVSKPEDNTNMTSEPEIVYEEYIYLKEGYTKFKQDGKWGIIKDNTIVIDPIYDEIGSYRNRFIGIYNGLVTRIINTSHGDSCSELEYKYRSTIKVSYVEENDREWIFEIRGEKHSAFGFVSKSAYNSLPELPQNNKEYYLSILSITYKNDNTCNLILGVISTKLQNKPYEHTDKDSDFEKGETYNGTVKNKKRNKCYVIMDNGKETYFTKCVVGSYFKSIQSGAKITLTKVDFDENLEKTIWKVAVPNKNNTSLVSTQNEIEKEHRNIQLRLKDILNHKFDFKVVGADNEGRYKLKSLEYDFNAFLDKKNAKNIHFNKDTISANVISEDKSGNGFMVTEV